MISRNLTVLFAMVVLIGPGPAATKQQNQTATSD